MYLVDTSVWLDFFRNQSTQAVRKFEEILDGKIPFGITGLIYQEVLQGADSPRDFLQLQTYLGTQKFYHPVDPVRSYEKAADLYFRCRREGITIRGSIDCLIAQVAIEQKLYLLHHDRDFTKIAEVIPDLKVA
ncbi:MAG: twitching motility protein PilT [Nitrospirales bacterium]|nr:MAG: twitching motility protein PilT [Nitrospirales bacterium]